MVTQGAFNLLFRPGLRADFLDSYEQHETEYTEFLRTGNIDKPEIAASIITGLSRMLEIDDGEPVTYEDPKIGPKVMAVDKEFALGFIITKKAVDDDQYNKANQAAKWLGHAAQMTKEYRAAGVLDDAFTGTNYKGIDGLALCSTAHTLLNSASTVANRPASDIQLSVTGITNLLDLAMLMKDENGDPVVMKPNRIIIGNNSGDLHRAMNIFGSDKEPYTAENQDNAIKKRFQKMKIVVSHYKSSSKSYFMIDDNYNDAWFLMRSALEFDDTYDFDTRAAKYMAAMRFLIWFVHWKGWLGCNPT
jgi:hypothetical protein